MSKTKLTPDSPEVVAFLETWNKARAIRNSDIIYGSRAYKAKRFQLWPYGWHLRGDDYKKDRKLRKLERIEEKSLTLLGTINEKYGTIKWYQLANKLLGIEKFLDTTDYYLIPIRKLKKAPVIPESFIANSSSELKRRSLFWGFSFWKLPQTRLPELAGAFTLAEKNINGNSSYNREKRRFEDWLNNSREMGVPLGKFDWTDIAMTRIPDVFNCPPDAISKGYLGYEVRWYSFKDGVVGIAGASRDNVYILSNRKLRRMPRFSQLEEKKTRERYLNSYSSKAKSVLGMED